MPRDHCARCGSDQNMRVTTTEQRELDEDGQERLYVVRTYHCETCGAFVRTQREEVRE